MSDQSASMLRCPSCGAPAAPHAVRCEYCRARLATISCPVCFGHLFQGAAFCPHCGAARSREEMPDAQPTRCPACRRVMHWVRVGTVDLLECEACDGTWIEAAAFERLCADRESQASVLEPKRSQGPADAARPGGAIGAQPKRFHYRPCPRCGKLMNRMNFGRMSGAVVDVCRGHGVFFDSGELHQVVRFILDGGLNKMRQAERDALVDEQRRLRELERGQARLEPVAGRFAWDERWVHDLLTALLK